ncbi:MAG: hypothetical protein MUC28_01635 [Planctomycetes bacterium]|nr:hypothetical protein [Planctomycetota bacterium]
MKLKEKIIPMVATVCIVLLFTTICFAGETGTCGYCSKDSDCKDGWCAPFDDGRSHCVPHSIKSSDDYSCSTGDINAGGAYGESGGGGCFIATVASRPNEDIGGYPGKPLVKNR